VRFTASRDGGTVYAMVLCTVPVGAMTLRNVGAPPTAVHLLGTPTALAWTMHGADLQVTLPPGLPPQSVYAFALSVRA
jgi:hypothetical protein